MRLCLCGTEASNGLIVQPLDARWMNTEQCWNMYLTCENLCQCHVVDHKYKRTVPGLNSGLCGEKSAHNHLSMAGVTFVTVVFVWKFININKNEDVLLRVNEQRNILHEIRKRKANWIGHILRRNCLLKQVIERMIKGEIEVTRRRGRRRKRLLDDLKDRRGYSHLKEEALDRTMWRNRFGGDFRPVVRQNTEWNENVCLG